MAKRDKPKQLVIIGGGFAGASAAVQVARYSPQPLRIAIFEPAADLGRGLAYQTADPDHRINAPMVSHPIDPADSDHIVRWVHENRISESDPASISEYGQFIRRRDFGQYLGDSVAQHALDNPSGSTIRHERIKVDLLSPHGASVRLALADGRSIDADAVIVATGNPPPKVPPLLAPFSSHRAMVVNPWLPGKLAELPPDANIAVMGTSLTAADILATLIRQGHRGSLVAFSRRGLRPRPARSPNPAPLTSLPTDWLMRQIGAPMPDCYRPADGSPVTVRFLLRTLRERIDLTLAQGEPWQAAFDQMRDTVWRFYPDLSDREKRRFIARLRVWYDVHRFRTPPQTRAILEQAIDRKQLRFDAHRLGSIESLSNNQLKLQLTNKGVQSQLVVDAFVNCTGLDMGGPVSADSLAGRLLQAQLLTPHGSGFGYAVDMQCRPIGPDGQVAERVRFVGPSTAGVFGDPLGALFIGMQIRRMLPGLWRTLS